MGEHDEAWLLAARLAAGLCHDLAGPVEALSSVAGLLDQPRVGEEAIEVAREATETLAHRLRLLRAAWAGLATAVTTAEIARFCRGLPRIERLRLDLSGLDGKRAYEPRAGQALLALFLLAAEALPRGGAIGLTEAGEGGLLLRIEGMGAAWPKGLAGAIAGEPDPAGSQPLAARLAVWTAAGAGLRVSMLHGRGGREPAPLLVSGLG